MNNYKLADRVRNLEIGQKQMASSNFNLSRQVSDFDKLHKSLLELLEDVEDIETKIDKTVPEIRREISKVEIDSAQLSSDQNILKEEDHNMAKTIQALAVSISTLQNERSSHRNLDNEVNNLKMEIEILKASSLSCHNKVSKGIWASFLRNRTGKSSQLLLAGLNEQFWRDDFQLQKFLW